ncbi:unnamed protein product [Protopolystoma xenopodis]|uniref:Uncharacterized protein n=1 Tax=Protopolystoma xenopodis TaxID=117903 RepID=A0A448X4A3_9PLAT|nr:unnamed protein product [Protopolystoma xenopodis]
MQRRSANFAVSVVSSSRNPQHTYCLSLPRTKPSTQPHRPRHHLSSGGRWEGSTKKPSLLVEIMPANRVQAVERQATDWPETAASKAAPSAEMEKGKADEWCSGMVCAQRPVTARWSMGQSRSTTKCR